MSGREKILEMLGQVLTDSANGLQLEVLELEIAKKLGRPISRKNLEELLVRHPDRFEVDGGGHWQLKIRAQAIEVEQPALLKTSSSLKHGCYVVFDLETLGKDAESEETEIIEIAYARYENNKQVESWQTFVKPSVDIPQLITELTTIEDKDVCNAPNQKEALEEFFKRTQGYPLIAHNCFAFDRVVLLNIAARLNIEVPKDLVFLDTLPLARIFHQKPGQRHTNEDLAQLYNSYQEGAHRADVDVAMLCGVVSGLLAETNNHPAGVLIYELLHKANEPWADLLDKPKQPLDLDNVLAQLGKAQLPLLPAKNKASGIGAETKAVDAIFDEMLARGRDSRASQKRFSHLAADAFRTKQFAVVEAGTGTGKSLGYLIPAALQAHSQSQAVVVSTYTKILQNQLVEKDIAFLQELIPNLTAVTLKGRGNYLSINKLQEELLDAVEEDFLSRARGWTLSLLTSLAIDSPTGDLETTWFTLESLDEYLDSQGEPFIIQNNVSAKGASQADKTSNKLDFYDRAKENASRADIIVVNHSLLLAQAVMTEDDRLPELISPFVICDESHNLEDAATSVLKQEISEKHLRRLIYAIYDEKRRTGLLANARKIGISAENEILKKTTQALFESNLHIDNISTRLQTFVGANTVVSTAERARFGVSLELRSSSLSASGGPALRESAIALLDTLDKLSTALTDLAKIVFEQTYKASNRNSQRVARLAYSLAMDLFDAKKILNWFWKFYEATTYVRVIKLEPDRQNKLFWTLEGLPIDVSALLHDRLWSRLDAAVFCSATLATHGDEFGFFLRRNGLERLQKTKVVTEILPHVFDYKQNALLMLPAHLPTPRDEALKKEFPQAVAAELLRFIPYFRGRTLGLFTARSRMRMVYEQIGSTLHQKGYPILCQGEGALAKLREEFEKREEVSLFGVRSLWEGVDVPGRSLSFVFMSKMPFPSLGDPLESARMNAVERAGGNGFYDYFLPKTIFTFKQGFGRLIRSKSDRGVVIFLDKRLRGATYRPDVLNSLPDPMVGYESDLDMYKRVCDWMGEPFNESLLPPVAIHEIERILAEHTLKKATFSDSEFDKEVLPHLLAVLKSVWGFDSFRKNQLDIVRAVLTGNDLLGLFPTGAGKSLTFQLPALVRPGLTLVISPLIALIRDQVQKLRHEAEVKYVNCLVSGMTSMEQEEVLAEAKNKRLRILYVSPERLRDPRFRMFLAELPIVQLVVDEAHCISTWGHDFRPDFLEIATLLPATKNIAIQALTATATTPVRSEIEKTLELGKRGLPFVTMTGDFRRDNLVFRVFHPSSAKDRDALTISLAQQIVSNSEKGGAGVIYVATRRESERLATFLRSRNIAAQAYHAGLPTSTRHHVQELFMQGEIQVVVATNAFGMGVDKQEIRFVIHYDHPNSVEAYVQESGRAGRDGKEAYAILIYSSATQRTHRFLAKKGIPTVEEISEIAERILAANFYGAVRSSDGKVFTSFENMVTELDFEEAKLRVIVHALEQAEVIKREEDFVLEATILLNNDLDDILNKLSSSEQELFEVLIKEFSLKPNVRCYYRALPLIEKTNFSPYIVEALLTKLAQNGELIFRAYARGSSFNASINANNKDVIKKIATDFLSRFQQFDNRLKDMIKFAEMSVNSRECRAAYLINYLTGDTNSPRCGKCDLCSSSYPVPWNMSAVVAPEPLKVEPIIAILEAVRDHNSQYGKMTLKKMLLGEGFGKSGGKTYELPAYARRSEHFGVLKNALNHEKLQHYFDRLIADGYISEIERQLSKDKGIYTSIQLTPRGRDILAGAEALPGSIS